MDNLFDLNDYEDKDEVEEVHSPVCETSKSDKNTMYQIDKINEIINIDTNKEMPSENHDDSFETKIAVSSALQILPAAKEKSIYALDDTIDIKEFDKINNKALEFPFELDIFQKRSVIRLERHENVLVCAHTSSGKTVVAEYAIALGRSQGKRVFYTSPIKALSNQKYREFKSKFGDVGILTGDVSINADAQCVIMTTEILQSSLYKNSEMLNMVDWVVFDEVHYINDNERGHVWEEILILLPPRIGIVMLSATVPNYLEFAKWVGRIKNTTIYIQNTLKRVVPLEHKIFISNKKVFIVKDKNDKVLQANLTLAMKELEELNEREFKNKHNPKAKKERENFEIKRLDQMRNFYRGLERKEKENFNRNSQNKNINNNNNISNSSLNNSINSINSNKNNNSEYSNKNFNKNGNIVGLSNTNNSYKNNGNYNNNFDNKTFNKNNSYSNSSYGGNNQSTGGNYNNNNQSYGNKGGAPFKQNRITITHMKLEEIVKFLFESDLTPAVIFVFSIKKIDEYARLLALEPRISKNESSQIISFFDKCMSKLSPDDKQINQVQLMRRILPHGIGVHHAGLLPILKETIEILYSKGLIKILFATTSFSIGLNMPTRTVIFTDVEKYNDEKKEVLSSSEYLQMCGRAGRRGIDQIGHIFLLMGDKKNPPAVTELSHMMGGVGTQVESKFRLSYRTIISFLSRNIKNIMEFFKESYLENNKILIMPETIKEVEEIKNKLMRLEKINCKFNDDGDQFVRQYYADENNLIQCRQNLFSVGIINSKLAMGRMVIIKNKVLNKNVPALVLHYYSEYCQYRVLFADKNKKLIINYEQELSNMEEKSDPHQGIYNEIYFQYSEIYVNDIVDILDSTIKMNKEMFMFDKEDYIYIKPNHQDKIFNSILEVQTKNVKIIDYLKVSNNDVEPFNIIKKKDEIQRRVKESKCDDCEYREEHLKIFKQRKMLEDKFHEKSSMLSSENLKYYNDFKNRLEVLKKLGYIDEEDQILLKGKAARELATSDCILISELLMSNVLDKLDVAESVAFISGFAYSKNEIETEDPLISDNFSQAVEAFSVMLDGLIKLEESLGFEESKYNRRITFAVSKCIHLWMNGYKFKDILDVTDLEEGKLYNLIMRLYLFLEEVINFAKVIGNGKLAEKFQAAKDSIMRDILSCRSLYLQEDIDIDHI